MKSNRIISSIILIILLCVASLASAAPVSNLRSSVSPARVRIVLDSSEPIAHKVHKDGLTLEVALPNSTATTQQAKLKDASIKSVRLVPDSRGGAKLMIELNKDCQYKVYQLQGPHRLVVDLFRINIVKQSKQLANGVTYTYLQDEMNGRQIQAYLVSVEPRSQYQLLPFSAAGDYNGRGKLSQYAAHKKLLAAINASYFDTDGWVIGNVKKQGQLMAVDEQPRSGYLLNRGLPDIVQDIA